MNIKKFLKPNWRKIVLFIIIFVLLFYSEIICKPMYVKTTAHYDFTGTSKSSEGWLYPCGFLSQIVKDSITYLLLSLLISYFLSCLIVWIYDKVKKK